MFCVIGPFALVYHVLYMFWVVLLYIFMNVNTTFSVLLRLKIS